MVSDKLVSYSKLNRLTKALDNRLQLSKAELEELIAEVRDMFGGKSICYITQAEYDIMTEDEKNDETKTYFITDASDSHEHGDLYYTEAEIDEKIENINENINEVQAEIDLLNENKANKSDLETLDAITLNGYSIWVGTTAELEAIGEKDSNTIYFEIDDGSNSDEVVQVDIVDGILQLTTNKYQKTTMVDGTEVLFPNVDKFTEIHLYFNSDSPMNITFPECKWRVEPNLEEGKTYEIVATYNTMDWLVNVIVYS